jgi:dihydroorotate dehydrogenase
MDAEGAYAKIRAGATLVQVYTGLVYGGPAFVKKLHEGLAALLARDGFGSVAEAVGTAHPLDLGEAAGRSPGVAETR